MPLNGKRKIGVLVELTRQFGRDLCQGITDFACKSDDISPFFISPAALSRTTDLKAFDGFIARLMNDEMAEILLACGKPIVDVYYEKPRLGVAVVKTNHAQIGRLAADHFISRRFSHFAFCGFAGGRFSHYCLLAFSRALAAQGHRCEVYQPDAHARYDFDHAVLINERLDLPPDRVALRRWVKSLTKPVAVFCPNDLRAWQLLQVCQSVGIRVPQDVAIMGLDNDFVVCGFSNPMLSSIDPDTAVIGRTAAKTLREMMDDDGFREKTLVREVAPKGVVERDSTAIYPLIRHGFQTHCFTSTTT